MGTLFLPSLKEKKFFEIKNVSLEDATEMVTEFTEKVKTGHKIKDTGQAQTSLAVFNNVLEDHCDYYDEDFEAIADVLKIADTRGTRGARAVFVEEDGTFAVGTTVVYNRNWATVNFADSTVISKLEADGSFSLNPDLVTASTPSDPNSDSKSWW